MSIVKIDAVTLKPVTPAIDAMAGTEDGHFFNIVSDYAGVLVGFRNIHENYSQQPSGETRIRVEGVNEGSKVEAFLLSLGFSRKDAGHYSRVVDSGTTRFINVVRDGIQFIA